jgi:hypothetical protein
MAKSDRNLKGKKKKKYNTAGHVSDERLKKGARLIVEKYFEPHHYRVIKTFTINSNITARLNEKIDHHGLDSFELIKRDGSRIKFEVNAGKIKPFIKLGALVMGDIL